MIEFAARAVEFIAFDVDDFAAQDDCLSARGRRPASGDAHFLSQQEPLFQYGDFFDERDDEDAVFVANRRRHAVYQCVDRNALDHQLFADERSIDDFFMGLDALGDAHFRARDPMRLDRKLFGNDRNDDLADCCVRTLETARRDRQAIGAVVLANERVRRSDDAGTVVELDGHSADFRVGDNQPADAVITHDRSISHGNRGL